MDNKDNITIERWELEDVIDTFRMLVSTFPKINERDSCLDRHIMKSYARLVYLYNGEPFDHHQFVGFYMGKKQIPDLKKEDNYETNRTDGDDGALPPSDTKKSL